ncbi:YfjI family protein [Tomitella fengzijianii]|uniref:DUF3987 domain-containing protein n=1 Tax=Tomitella fengzijianii TaxID=2597660 RepID=A0A516X4X1_9ACTN|nr:YfjI family protein [Tomitella fengzijianii]QDQ98107.1 DUF3987 domain-containing protein [Tomitella fengzijianii]
MIPYGTEADTATEDQIVAALDGPADPPTPLTATRSIPQFPVDALPTSVRAMVEGTAEATQTDPAMAGTSALSALSACTGGHAQIEIRSGWREPLCGYFATVAGPGERKSSVQHSMIAPLLDVEAQLAELGMAARMEAETLKSIAVAEAEKARKIAANATDNKSALQADAVGAAQTAESMTVPAVPRLVADDVTPEAAASLLAEQGGRLAIISAEGGIFDIIAGRYSKSIPNLDLWLKGHAGDPLKVDRKGREPEYVRHPALTLGLMIQPSVLSALSREESFRGRGFLARILFACPVSKVGARTIAPAPVTEVVRAAYTRSIGTLAEGMAGWNGDPAVLVLSPPAHDAVRSLEEAVEPTLAGNGELASIADWGAKYVGAVCRIAGMLHLAEYGHDVGVRCPVAVETIEAATRVGGYFKACAIKVFAEMGMDQITADAIYLLERIEHIGEDVISERDMQRAARRFKSKTELQPALDRLIEYRHLLPIPAPGSGASVGRSPSPTYRLNHGTQRTQRTEPPSEGSSVRSVRSVPTPGGSCRHHPDVNLTAAGKCWQCSLATVSA